MYNDSNHYNLGALADYTPISMPVFTNATASIQASPAAASSGGNFWSSLVNIGNKVADTVKTVATIAKDLKSQIEAIKSQTQQITSGGSYTSSGASSSSGAPPADTGMSTGAKVAIGVGVLAVLGGGGYLIYQASHK
jgi:hypothetical protein